MSKKIITSGVVHLIAENGDVVTLTAGDEVPAWANVTNPALFEEVVDSNESNGTGDSDQNVNSGDTPATDNSADTTGGKKAKSPTVEELREEAKSLGIATSGNKKALAERIAAKRAETVDAPADAPTGDRAAIEAALTERGIEFDADNTDDELALILENAE